MSMSRSVRQVSFLFSIFTIKLCTATVLGGNIPPVPTRPPVKVQKCCPEEELMYVAGVGGRCEHPLDMKLEVPMWKPVFTDENGKGNVQVGEIDMEFGFPQCGSKEHFPIFHYRNSHDKLALLPNGHLRHYYKQHASNQEVYDWEITPESHNFYDFKHGLYCKDQAVIKQDNKSGIEVAEYAVVCNPHVPRPWHSPDFVLRRIVDPVCHGIGLACYLAVAIVHFVLPQLRDLAGNILTTLTLSLAVGEVADIIKIFTEFTNPTSYLVADCILYICILGAFFWLNSLGYYIWKTFRSRNVFLRITDGRKYCYYSFYVWGCTIGMSIFAIFAHFTLDIETSNLDKAPSPIAQGALGWLGVAVFFTPIAFIILINIMFYVTTVKIIDRMSTYGRIHHKLKYSFDMFMQLFIVMTIGWLFLMMSWLPYNSMYYIYIFSNALQAPIILYISVLSQKRVRYLLRKVCCYDKCFIPCFRPDENEGPEWGEEMMAMNR